MSAIIAEAALYGVPDGLRTPLIVEYNKLSKAFREGKWEPAELSGGKICEIIYSILRGHVDGHFAAQPFKPANMVDACRQLEQASGFPRSIRVQIPRLLIALYEVRNNRNVGHVGGDVDPSHMDAALVFHTARWLMSELVRIYHAIQPEEATQVVECLTERSVPILWRVGGMTRVLGGLNLKNKTLVLLYGNPGPLSVDVLVRSLDQGRNRGRYLANVIRPAHRSDLLYYDSSARTAQISPLGTLYVESSIELELPGKPD